MGSNYSKYRWAKPALALALVAVVSTGCSASPDTEAPADEPRELTVWFPGNSAPEIEYITETVVPAFEAEYNAEVEVTFVDWGDLDTKLSAAFAGGTAPDVFGHGPAAVAGFVQTDRLLDLTPLVAELPGEDQDDLSGVLPGGQVNGKQYLMSLTSQGVLLAYDKADLESSGIGEDDLPETWEDLLDVADALTVRSGDTITRSGLFLPSNLPTQIQQSYAALLAGAGGSILNEDGTEATVNSAEGLQALEYFIDLFVGDSAVATDLGVEVGSLPPAEQPIATDRASIQAVTASQATKILDAVPDLELGFLQPLRFEDSENPAAYGGAGVGLMINADTASPNLAWDFVSYAVSPEVSEGYATVLGAIPNRISVAEALGESGPVIAAWAKAAPYWVPNPNVPGWVQIRDTMDKQLERALRGAASAEDVLAAMEADINALLAENQ